MNKKGLIRLTIIFILFNMSVLFSSCWDYRESEDLGLVSSAALDINEENNKLIMTVELLKPTGGPEAQVLASVFTSEGDTVFDCARNIIRKTGLKLYWGHNHYLIINESLAKKGLTDVTDFFARDPEGRLNVHIMVSKEKTAGEILMNKININDSNSVFFKDVFNQSKNISKYSDLEMWKIIKLILEKGNPVLPGVKLVKNKSQIIPEVTGSAVFRGEKFIGWIDEIETRSFLFITDRIKGGLLVVDNFSDRESKVILEIMKNKTDIKVSQKDNKPVVEIKINTQTEIGELIGNKSLFEPSKVGLIKEHGEKLLKEKIEKVIKKSQEEFNTDIFNFKKKIEIDQPELYKEIKNEYNSIYSDLETLVSVNIEIKGSAQLYKPIREGGYD